MKSTKDAIMVEVPKKDAFTVNELIEALSALSEEQKKMPVAVQKVKDNYRVATAIGTIAPFIVII